MKVQCAVEIEAELGEGPFWSVRDSCLYWMDMYSAAIYRYRPQDGSNIRLIGPNAGQIGGLLPCKSGGFVLGLPEGLAFYDVNSCQLTPFVDPRSVKKDVHYNDAKADAAGRLWIDTYHEAESEPVAALYGIEPDGAVASVVDGLIVGNGPAFAPDGRTLYIADSAIREIYAYDVDPETGTLGPRRLFAGADSAPGMPDGMTTDRDGGLWNARYMAGQVVRYTPEGELDVTIPLPVPLVTSCMFGGADLATLYVTSASAGMSAEERKSAPLSGSLFAVETGYVGLPEPEFAG